MDHEQRAYSWHLEEVTRDRDPVREESNTFAVCMKDQTSRPLHDGSPDFVPTTEKQLEITVIVYKSTFSTTSSSLPIHMSETSRLADERDSAHRDSQM